MSILKRASFGILGLALIHPGSAFAQATEPVVHASVIDDRGAPVTSLTATDFVVSEDGAAREVLRVDRASDPMQIAVLVDTSAAVEPYVNDLRRALKSFFHGLAGNNELALIEFGDRPAVLVDYTSDRARLAEGADRVFARPNSGARLLDAIIETSKGLRTREGARSAIVVITAEGPEFSDRYHEAVLEELRRTDTSLYAFVLARTRRPLRDRNAQERDITLADGTQLTGGRREILLTSMALDRALHTLSTQLENQYVVAYSRPGSLVTPHALDIRVTRPGLTVLAPRTPRQTGRRR